MRKLILVAGHKDAAANLARDYNNVVNVAQLRRKGYSGTV
jgi:hypothetical protein